MVAAYFVCGVIIGTYGGEIAIGTMQLGLNTKDDGLVFFGLCIQIAIWWFCFEVGRSSFTFWFNAPERE